MYKEKNWFLTIFALKIQTLQDLQESMFTGTDRKDLVRVWTWPSCGCCACARSQRLERVCDRFRNSIIFPSCDPIYFYIFISSMYIYIYIHLYIYIYCCLVLFNFLLHHHNHARMNHQLVNQESHQVLRVLRTLRFFRELRLMLDCVLGSVLNAIWCLGRISTAAGANNNWNNAFSFLSTTNSWANRHPFSQSWQSDHLRCIAMLFFARALRMLSIVT